MKKNMLFILLPFLLSALVFVFICLPGQHADIRAVDGVLDLRGQDLSSVTVELSGTWFVSFNGGEPVMVEFPSRDSLFDAWGYGVGDTQVCSLTILTDEDIKLDLYVPEIEDAYEVWVNNELLFSTHKEQSTLVSFTPQNGISVLEIVSESHLSAKNGLRHFLPVLAVSPSLQRQHTAQQIVVAFLLGGFLLIGLYHLMLYFFSAKGKLYLLFALMCAFEVAHLLLEAHGLMIWLWPMDFTPYNRIYMLMICLHGIFMCFFTSAAFELKYCKAEKTIITLLFAIPTLSVLFLPLLWAINIILLGYVPMLMYVVKIIASKKYKGNPYLLLYFISLILFMVSGIIKLRYDNVFFMIALTYSTFMIVSQCLLLSRHYMSALVEVEALNQTLEKQVEDRTFQLAQSNEKLMVSQGALKEMIGSISHDVKTPLTILGQYLELLDDSNVFLDDTERTDYIHVAYNKNLTLQRLIRNLFEATKIETGQIAYNMEWLPLSTLLSGIKERHEKYLQSLGLRFTVECEKDCLVKLDPDKIWSVFDNILYNAARHTPMGGAIAVTAAYSGNACVIQISDTGEGISAEHLPFIFDKFYKATKARNAGSGDSGIGLYIAKTVLLGMDSTIKAVSEPGHGATFIITLNTRSN